MKTNCVKRILAFCLSLVLLIGAIPLSAIEVHAAAAELTGDARSATNTSTGDVFLGGKYIELGISKHGSFGTSASVPSGKGFYTSGQLGMKIDGDGWGTGSSPTTGDFFLPGSPEERYILAYYYNGTVYEFPVADRQNVGLYNWSVQPTVKDASYGNTLCAIVTGKTIHGVEMKITYSFKDTDKAYSTKFEITNTGSLNITNLRFVRSFDPDQDATRYNNFDTYNKVICNPTSDLPASETNYAMVVAKGGTTREGFFFVAFDNRARASRGVEFSLSSAYKSGLWTDTAGLPTYATDSALDTLGTKEDSNIAITFQLGTLASGASTDGIFYSSLSPDVSSSLEEVTKPYAPIINSVTGAELAHGYTDGEISVDVTPEHGHSITSYQWYKTTSNTNEGGIPVEGATEATYKIPTGKLSGIVEYYYCVITAQRDDNGLTETATTDPVMVKYLDGEHQYETVYTPATCSSQGKITHTCVLCGKVVTESVSALGHDFVHDLTVDPTCTKDGYMRYVCSREGCGAEKKQILTSAGHELVDNACTKCDYRVPVVHTHDFAVTTVEPSCTEMGYTLHACDCGYSYRTDYIEQTGHKWGDGEITVEKTCYTDGVMTYHCTKCEAAAEESIPKGHAYTESVIKEATCTEDGEIHLVCSKCGVTEIETVTAAHKWIDKTVDVEPDCMTGGTKTSECEGCGMVETFTVEATGHQFKNGVCENCAMSFIDAVTPNPDHIYYGMFFEIDDILSKYGPDLINEYGLLLDVNEGAVIERVAVYLEQDGTMWRRCIAVVGTGITYANYVPYLSYDEDLKYTGLNSDMINVFPLSENAEGIWCYSNYVTIGVNLEDKWGNLLLSLYDIGQAGKNTRIFDDLEEMIAWLSEVAHVHSYEKTVTEPTCTADGYTEYKCAECGHEYVGDYKKAAHTESEWIIDTEPTCTAPGKKHTVCTVCEEVVHESYITAKGHNYVSVLTKTATCTEPGILTYTCSQCSDSYNTYIHAEHAYELTETIAPTCTEDGKQVFTCKSCSDAYEKIIPGAHNYESEVTKVATEEQDGAITYTCTICSDSYVTVIPARPDASILLVQDVLPWDGNDNVSLLTRLVTEGYLVGWDATTVKEFCAISLASYNIIYIANDQTTATYEALAEFNDAITEFVMAGGTVIYGACDEGWSSGHLTHSLPGGVESQNYYSNHNYIVDGSHDIVTGILTNGEELTNALLYGNYCSHTSFVKSTLPDGANIITEDAHGNPTLVEYTLGAGHVIASGLTWEFYYERDPYDSKLDTTYSKTVFDDLLVYAIYLANNCDHAYGEGTVVSPTCTEKGYTEHTCEKCGMIMKESFTEPTGHLLSDWMVDTEATETEAGLRIKICTICNQTVATEIIPMTGAPVVRVEAPKDSVSLGDTVDFTLKVENGVIVDRITVTLSFDTGVFELVDIKWLIDGVTVTTDPATGAYILILPEEMIPEAIVCFTLKAKAMVEGFAVGANTEMALGEAAVPLSVVSKNLTISTCAHTDALLSYVDDTYHAVLCNTCGYTALVNHIYSDEQIVTDAYFVADATCTTGMLYAYGCACGKQSDHTFEYGEPLGHAFGEYVYNNDETYTEDGTSTAQCARCEATDTITVSGTALGLVRKFKDETAALGFNDEIKIPDKHMAIREAILTYNSLSEEEKASVLTEYSTLLAAIDAYNTEAKESNAELSEASELAFAIFSGSLAILSALWFLLKKRFMM